MAKDKSIPSNLVFTREKFKYDTIEDMRNDVALKIGDVVELNGYYEAGDGADHKRKIEAQDDGSGVMIKNVNDMAVELTLNKSEPELYRVGLYANIVHNGEVNVSWFGTKGDGITDDSEIINKIIKNRSIKKCILDAKSYLISNTINLCSLGSRGVIFEGVSLGYGFGVGTELIADTGNFACVEIIGTEDTLLKNIHIRNRGKNVNTPSKLGIFIARGKNTPNAQRNNLDNVFISLESDHTANNGNGTIGLYNNRAEMSKYKNVFIFSDLPLAITKDFVFYTPKNAELKEPLGVDTTAVINCDNIALNSFKEKCMYIERGTQIMLNMPYFANYAIDKTGCFVSEFYQSSNVTINNMHSEGVFGLAKYKGYNSNINWNLGIFANCKDFVHYNADNATTKRVKSTFSTINFTGTPDFIRGDNIDTPAFQESVLSYIPKDFFVRVPKGYINSCELEMLDISSMDKSKFILKESIEKYSNIINGFNFKLDTTNTTITRVKHNITGYGSLKDLVDSFSEGFNFINNSTVSDFNYPIFGFYCKRSNDINNANFGIISTTSITKDKYFISQNKEGNIVIDKMILGSNMPKGYRSQLLGTEGTGAMFFDLGLNKPIFKNSNGEWVDALGQNLIQQLDTPYYTSKMQQEGVYQDFVSYMDAKVEYDNQMRMLDRQGMMTLSILEEPQPSQALKDFMKKYL